MSSTVTFVILSVYLVYLESYSGVNASRVGTISLVSDEVYDKLFSLIEEGLRHVPYSRRCEVDQHLHRLLKKFDFVVTERFDFLKGKQGRRLCVIIDGNAVIYPRYEEEQDIISHFYKVYKGEGSRKLYNRIRANYVGISRKVIQQWINSNEEHCKRNPVFLNKAPLQPVISHTVNSRHQIDLVNFEDFPQLRDGEIFSYVLAVEDIFSRYLFLYATTSKEPQEILDILKKIYR